MLPGRGILSEDGGGGQKWSKDSIQSCRREEKNKEKKRKKSRWFRRLGGQTNDSNSVLPHVTLGADWPVSGSRWWRK